MIQYSHDELLDGVRERNAAVLNYIYRSFFPNFQSYVIKNGGSAEDAKDVFQESLIVMYRYMKQNPPPEIKDFRSYVYGMCRNLWLKILERREETAPIPKEYDREVVPAPDSPEVDASMKYSIMQKHFLAMDPDSQKVLKLFYKNASFSEIAKKMGYKDENYARRKKYLCQKELAERIKNDPQYKDCFK